MSTHLANPPSEWWALSWQISLLSDEHSASKSSFQVMSTQLANLPSKWWAFEETKHSKYDRAESWKRNRPKSPSLKRNDGRKKQRQLRDQTRSNQPSFETPIRSIFTTIPRFFTKVCCTRARETTWVYWVLYWRVFTIRRNKNYRPILPYETTMRCQEINRLWNRSHPRARRRPSCKSFKIKTSLTDKRASKNLHRGHNMLDDNSVKYWLHYDACCVKRPKRHRVEQQPSAKRIHARETALPQAQHDNDNVSNKLHTRSHETNTTTHGQTKTNKLRISNATATALLSKPRRRYQCFPNLHYRARSRNSYISNDFKTRLFQQTRIGNRTRKQHPSPLKENHEDRTKHYQNTQKTFVPLKRNTETTKTTITQHDDNTRPP